MQNEKQYIYFLINKNQPVFKIGVSVNTNQRMKQLGGDFDLEKSFYIECEEAFVVEKILHRVFRKHNVVFTNKEGFTEWFDVSCFEAVVEFINKNKEHLSWSESFKISVVEEAEASGKVVLRGEALKARKAENLLKKQELQIELENINRSNAIYFRCMLKKMVLNGALIGKLKSHEIIILVFRKNMIPESTSNLMNMLFFRWYLAGINLYEGEIFWGSNKYRFISISGPDRVNRTDRIWCEFESIKIYLSAIEKIPTTRSSALLNEIQEKLKRLIRLKNYIYTKNKLEEEKKERLCDLN